MRAGRSVSKSFIAADGCAGHAEPRPGPVAVRDIPSVSHLTQPSPGSQMAARGAEESRRGGRGAHPNKLISTISARS